MSTPKDNSKDGSEAKPRTTLLRPAVAVSFIEPPSLTRPGDVGVHPSQYQRLSTAQDLVNSHGRWSSHVKRWSIQYPIVITVEAVLTGNRCVGIRFNTAAFDAKDTNVRDYLDAKGNGETRYTMSITQNPFILPATQNPTGASVTRVHRPDRIDISVEVLAPTIFPDDRSDEWIRAIVRWLVLHEVDEFIRVDGQRKYDPHQPGLPAPSPHNS